MWKIDELSRACNNILHTDKLFLDKKTESETIIFQYLEANPKLLISEFDKCIPRSVVFNAILWGSLHVADFILRDSRGFRWGADPFYCGQQNGNAQIFLYSAGINFYLALTALEFDDKQFFDASGAIKKTHYEALYWEKDEVKSPFSMSAYKNELQANAVNSFQQRTAAWFMERAYEIHQRKEALKDCYALNQPLQHLELGDDYLCIACLENSSFKAYCYFLDKALACYQRAARLDKKHKVLVDKLQSRINDADKIFNQQQQIYRATFKLADNDLRARTLEEWQLAYNACYHDSRLCFTKKQEVAIQMTANPLFLDEWMSWLRKDGFNKSAGLSKNCVHVKSM